jgi:peptidoglycan/xylan/chitin deacetylase (PgdA/CDA1 family)
MKFSLLRFSQKTFQWIKRFLVNKRRKIIVIFRYDDFSTLSRTDLELSILDVCRKNNVRFTFAVIPFVVEGDVHDPGPQKLVPLSEEKAKILRNGINEGLIDVALHGYSHQSNTSTIFSELAGLNYDLQLKNISEGKVFLEDVLNTQIDIFAPPWNSYNENTLIALENLGFSTLTAGRDGKVSKNSKLKFLPSTCSLKRLKSAIQEARRNTSNIQPIIVVLFHEFEILDIDQERGMISFQDFSEMISWLNSQKDVRVLSVGQSIKTIKDLGPKRFLSKKKSTSPIYQ